MLGSAGLETVGAECHRPQTCPFNAPAPADGPTSCFYSTVDESSTPEEEGLLQKVEAVVQCEEEMQGEKQAYAVKFGLDQGSSPTNSTGWTGPPPSKPVSESPRRVAVGPEQKLNVTFFRKGNATDAVKYGLSFQRNHSDLEWISPDFAEGSFEGADYNARTFVLTFRLRDSVSNGAYVNVPFTIWEGPGQFHSSSIGFIAKRPTVDWMLVILVAIGIGLLVILAIALGRRKK